MKSSNYVVIQGWMCNELGLKGNELLVFALIHGFSQDEVSKFSGSRSYIADTFNITLPTVDKALQGLLDKEYIKKHISGDYTHPDTYWVNFEVVKKLYMGCKETLHGGCKETLHDNTINKNNIKNIVNSSSKKSNASFLGSTKKAKKSNPYSECLSIINDFTSNTYIRKGLNEFLQIVFDYKHSKGFSLHPVTWKKMLNNLEELAKTDKEKLEVINYTVSNGYMKFIKPGSYSSSGSCDIRKGKPWEKGVTSETYTEEEKREIDRQTAEREARGEQVWY